MYSKYLQHNGVQTSAYQKTKNSSVYVSFCIGPEKVNLLY